MCNARRVLLRSGARDESSARNSVSRVTYDFTVRGKVTSVYPPLE